MLTSLSMEDRDSTERLVNVVFCALHSHRFDARLLYAIDATLVEATLSVVSHNAYLRPHSPYSHRTGQAPIIPHSELSGLQGDSG